MCVVFDQVNNVWVLGEVLVGVVVVKDGVVIVIGFNQFIGKYDLIVYVEIMVLCWVVEKLGNYCLFGCEFYVMLEFCVMCFGVMMYVCLVCVVYGVVDLKIGVCGLVVNLFEQDKLNYYIELLGGVMVEECGQLLKEFFVM